MASRTEAPLSDENWLISQAKATLKTDQYASKSWLLVARTLFPRSFAVQYEAYQMEKDNKNVKEMAKLIEEMLRNFPGEPQLWAEIQNLTEALQTDSTSQRDTVLRDAFAALPPSLQCHLLLRITETTPDVLQQCKLMLLILNRYPDQVQDQGVKLIDSLLTAEKQSQATNPVNCYRKYLVYDVLPLVLAGSLPQVTPKQLYRWLQKAIEFYIAYMTQPSSHDTPLSPQAELLSPNSVKTPMSYPSHRRMSIAGLSDTDSNISEPWHQLFSIVSLTARHLGWQIGDLLDTNRGSEWQWQQVQAMYDSLATHPDPSVHMKQLLYCCVILFLHSLYHYSVRAQPHMLATGGSQTPLVLIEAFKVEKPVLAEHKHKKLKVEGGLPVITPSPNVSDPKPLLQNFLMAVKCWQLLHSTDALEKEFYKLLQHWKSHTWGWLQNFEVDVLIYQGYFKEATAKLRNANRSPVCAVRSDIQLACCLFCLGNYARACEVALNAASSLPPSPPGSQPPKTPEPELPAGSSKARQLQLVSCNEAEMMPYCLHLIITCLQEKVFKYAMPNDMALGHLLVLLQYDWPRYESVFSDAMVKILHQNSFTYNLFFNFVVNIDMLEEFADIRSQVNLDILPCSTRALAQSRTVTRGVNKGVNEDFKVAMEKQVARSNENVDIIIKNFLTEEKELLKQSLV